MTDLSSTDVVRRYFVNDLPGASIPATRLRNIINNLDQGHLPTTLALNYIQQQGLAALHRLALREITYEEFCKAAIAEQAQRGLAAEALQQIKEAERLVREKEQKAYEAAWVARDMRERQQAEEARRARESDPTFIAKMKSQQLRARYGIDGFIEKQSFSRLMNILHRFDSGNRLTDEDVLWLTIEGKDYYSINLQRAFHEREAEFYASEYKRTSDPWMAVNASGHYRKCDQAKQAHDLLTAVPADRPKAPKLRSAICTTHGGVMRDLKRLDEALNLGTQAHSLTPNDFRPCTLLGAVNFELGHYSIGQEWHRKAIERGASERSIDSDLRGIFLRADQTKREEIKIILLREDPVRYRWVNEF
jgi:hypothetical protein